MVTGGSGRIGKHVVEKLAASGYRLRVATPDPVIQTSNVRWVPIDFINEVDYDSLVAGVEVIIHLAAELWEPSRMDAVNVSATRRLAIAAEEAGVRAFVYTSSISVYGFPAHPHVDESTPTLPIGRELTEVPYLAQQAMLTYALTKLQGERELQGHLLKTKLVILRLAMVVSELDVAAILDWGYLRRVWRAYRRTHHIYVEDVAAAIEFFVEPFLNSSGDQPQLEGTFIVSEDHDPSNTFGDLFRRYEVSRGSNLLTSGIRTPAWMDRLKDRVKFKRLRIGLPSGALFYSPDKLLSVGFKFPRGIVNVQNEVIGDCRSRDRRK